MSKNNKTKDLIFETAVKLIRETGNLTLKDISANAKVNIAAINYYFGDKETLIKEIIKSQLNKLKDAVEVFVDNLDTQLDYETNVRKLIGYLYDFSLKNIGIINFIFSSGNEHIMELSIYQYIHVVSLDKEFMDKLMKSMAKIRPSVNHLECQVKFVQLISTFAFPLLFELNLSKIDIAFFNRVSEPKFREKYIAQIAKTFFE